LTLKCEKAEAIKNASNNQQILVDPSVSLDDLKQSGRIGLALAIDWIAMRGQSMPLKDYNRSQDEAMRDLVTVLSNSPAGLVKQIILGTSLEDEASREKTIDPSIFFDIGVTDAEVDEYAWQMLLVDTKSEDTGQIVSMRGDRDSGWRNVNVGTDFLLENWPPFGQTPRTPQSRVVRITLKQKLLQVCGLVPQQFKPLTQSEIEIIARLVGINPPRQMVREIAKEIIGPLKRGSKYGPRNLRKNWFNDFLKEIAVAHLSKN
jgi:hypothetical protein